LQSKVNRMHKAGFVNIIGNPNVGKSTLMNAFVGEKLSIITSKAQTTRHRILGIVNGEDFQVILSYTPGIIKPAYELQESMMGFVKSAFEDADVLIYMVEIGEQELKDEVFFKKITNSKIPVLLLLNKIDDSKGLSPKRVLSDLQGSGAETTGRGDRANRGPAAPGRGYRPQRCRRQGAAKVPPGNNLREKAGL